MIIKVGTIIHFRELAGDDSAAYVALANFNKKQVLEEFVKITPKKDRKDTYDFVEWLVKHGFIAVLEPRYDWVLVPGFENVNNENDR